MPGLLSHAFMARDLLHEALDISTAVVFRETPAADILIVTTPLRPPAPATLNLAHPTLNLAIYEKPPTNHITCTAMLGPAHPAAHRTFALTRNNLLGYLGLTNVPIFQRPKPANFPEDKIDDWLREQLRTILDFKWNPPNTNVFLSCPLHPRSVHLDDTLRNPNPYPRFKVFHDRSFHHSAPWTFARLAPNGRDLAKHGPMFLTGEEAIEEAERQALREGHLPCSSNDPPRIVMWQSRFDLPDHVQHKAIINTGHTIEIVHEHQADNDPDDLPFTVTLRGHNGAEHHGTAFPDSYDEALEHALRLAQSLNPG